MNSPRKSKCNTCSLTSRGGSVLIPCLQARIPDKYAAEHAKIEEMALGLLAANYVEVEPTGEFPGHEAVQVFDFLWLGEMHLEAPKNRT